MDLILRMELVGLVEISRIDDPENFRTCTVWPSASAAPTLRNCQTTVSKFAILGSYRPHLHPQALQCALLHLQQQ